MAFALYKLKFEDSRGNLQSHHSNDKNRSVCFLLPVLYNKMSNVPGGSSDAVSRFMEEFHHPASPASPSDLTDSTTGTNTSFNFPNGDSGPSNHPIDTSHVFTSFGTGPGVFSLKALARTLKNRVEFNDKTANEIDNFVVSHHLVYLFALSCLFVGGFGGRAAPHAILRYSWSSWDVEGTAKGQGWWVCYIG